MQLQNRVKSWLMWAGIVATVIMGYVDLHGTSVVGGNTELDTALIWVCGLIAIIAQINNPRDPKHF